MIDLSKLADAVTKVAELASQSAAVRDERDAACAAIAAAQHDIDALTVTLLTAAGSPAEAHGIAAVAEALAAPVEAVVPSEEPPPEAVSVTPI